MWALMVFTFLMPDHALSSLLVAWIDRTGFTAPMVRRYKASYSFLLAPGNIPFGRASRSRLFARLLKSLVGAGLGWVGRSTLVLVWAGIGCRWFCRKGSIRIGIAVSSIETGR